MLPSVCFRSFVIAFSFWVLLSTGALHARDEAIERNSFSNLVKQTVPAVVNVYGERKERGARHPLFDDPLFRDFFGGAPRERVQRSVGSGVMVDATGLAVTNHHVIENMTSIKVALSDGREFDADVVLKDPRTDLALLRLKASGRFPAVVLADSDKVEVGDTVLAIGDPFGLGQTVTRGIVSALARTQMGVTDYQFFIQTDAAINPGNSGGALVDMAGQLVGVNTAIYSRSGGSHGVGFAIPANMVRVVVASAKSGQEVVRRPWLGAQLDTVTSELAEALKLDKPRGALVVKVLPGGPLESAGLVAGDVLLAINQQPIATTEELGYRVGTLPVGQSVAFTYMRRGREMTTQAKLTAPPERPARDPLTVRQSSPLQGAVLVNLSPAVAEELQLDLLMTGVAIADVSAGTTAAQLGFRKGDVLLALNGEEVKTPKDVVPILARGARFWRVTVLRDGSPVTMVFGG